MAGDTDRVRELLDVAQQALDDAVNAFDEEFPTQPIPPANVIRVAVGDDVQAALLQARITGATLLLAVGEHRCNLKVSADPIALPVLITSDTQNIPAPGQRIQRDAENGLARLKSANGIDPVLFYEMGSTGVNLTGVCILPQQYDRTVVTFGTDQMTDIGQQPYNVVHDRVLFLGDPVRGQHRAVMAHCRNYVLKNSAMYDYHEQGRDSQCVAAWNGGQNIIISNNFLEGGTENIMFGGGAARTEDMAPRNIIIDGNTISKNPAWISGMEFPPQIKCLLEIKQARRIGITRNVFQHNWTGAAMAGAAVVFKCCDQVHNEPWTLTENITFENNIIMKTGSGIVIVGANDDGYTTQHMRNVKILNNLIYDMDRDQWQGAGKAFAISIMPENLVIDHNTIIGNTWGMIDFYNPGPPKGQGFTFINTAVYQGDYGIKSKSGGNPENLETDLGYVPNVTSLAVRKDPARTCKFHGDYTIIPEADFDASFTANYEVIEGSAVHKQQTTDAAVIGADISQLP